MDLGLAIVLGLIFAATATSALWLLRRPMRALISFLDSATHECDICGDPIPGSRVEPIGVVVACQKCWSEIVED